MSVHINKLKNQKICGESGNVHEETVANWVAELHMHGNFYSAGGGGTDSPHDIQIESQIGENPDNENMYNGDHLYFIEVILRSYTPCTYQLKKTVALVRYRTMLTERPPLVGEVVPTLAD
jgi:hypothetical protein